MAHLVGAFCVFILVGYVCANPESDYPKHDSNCINPVVNGEHFYCPDSKFICTMCWEDTRYIGPCIKNNTQAQCVPCEPGTGNPSKFHMDTNCTAKPSNISKNPDSDGQKENSQGIRFSINSLLCFILLLYYLFAMN